MINSLINTKFGIPATRPALVPRRRLIERLSAGMHGKLALISAPAGYGKTTLAAEWLRETQRAVAWLSLDEADNDPARFLRYFLAALQVIDERTGEETRALLQAPEPPSAEALMTILLNEINTISTPFVLAMDDYHVIQTLSIHHLLKSIVEYQPGQMHLVLITREDPPFSLSRLRARGQITEVRQDDLRFTAQECAEFLEDVLGLKISKDAISALERRTEGWIAGLQLAAIAMQSMVSSRGQENLERFVQEFTGSNRYVLDYLAQEVFERQSGDVQNFLLKTSILDQLCASLCEQITEHPGSQDVIDALELANLFIVPLDQSRTWYRYHRLFRDLLRTKLQAFGSSTLNALHRRASAWYEKHDLPSNAIEHALAGADWEHALKLIRGTSEVMSKHGETFTLLNWYNQIPEHWIKGDAETCLDYIWALLLSSQFERARNYLTLVEDYAKDNPFILGQLFTTQAYLARAEGDNRRMIELSHKALSVLPKEDLNSRCLASINLGIAYWHSGKMDAAERALAEVLETGRATDNHYAISTALVFQGMVLAVRGRLQDANSRFQAVVQKDSSPSFILGLAYLYLAVIHYEWSDLEQSGKYLLEANRVAERLRNDELFVVNTMMMARIHMAGGNLVAAGDALEKAYQRTVEGEVSTPAMPRLAAARVQYAIACGDLESAARWAEQLSDGNDWHTFYRFTNVTQAVQLLAQNKTAEAGSHLERLFERASAEGWVYAMIAIRAHQALAAAEPEAALEYLKDALTWSQPEGFLRTFVDVGKGLKPLLQETIRRKVMADYAEKILSTMKNRAKEPILGQLALIEPLRGRELEVLRLLADGLTNRQIAEKLYISTGTVKTHVHNICGKLGCLNRTEAAARARELGLI